MSNYNQNPATKGNNIDIRTDEKKIELKLFIPGAVFLLCLAPYWLGLRESSCVFIFDRRMDINTSIDSVAMFFIHLFLTVFSFWILIKSGCIKYAADWVSNSDYMISRFDDEKKTETKKILLISKILTILIIIIFSYLSIPKLLKGLSLPTIEISISLMFVVFGVFVWNIEEKENNDHLYNVKFDLGKYNKKISNIQVFNNIDGIIQGELLIVPRFTNKAEFLKLRGQNRKINDIINENKLLIIINNVINECKIDENVEERRQVVAEFKNITSKELSSQKNADEVSRLQDKTSSANLTKQINNKILEAINFKIGQHPFNIKFNITKDTVKDSLLKEIDKVSLEVKERLNFEEQQREKRRIEEEKKSEDRRIALLLLLGNIILDNHNPIVKEKYFKLRIYIEGIEKIDKYTYVEIMNEINYGYKSKSANNLNEHFSKEIYEEAESTITSETFKEPSKNIADLLFDNNSIKINDLIKERLSLSTTIFEDYEIDIDIFLASLINNWSTFNAVRDKEAFIKLIFNLLFDLSNKKI